MDILLMIFNIIFLISCLSVSYLFKKSYPTDINGLFGYRTKRSMASKEAWIFANRYSSRLLFTYSFIAVSAQIVLFAFLGGEVALLGAGGLWIVMLLATILQTEVKLKKL